MKGSDDRTFLSKTLRTTDKLVLLEHQYCKTFSKTRVSNADHKEMNLNVGYLIF